MDAIKLKEELKKPCYKLWIIVHKKGSVCGDATVQFDRVTKEPSMRWATNDYWCIKFFDTKEKAVEWLDKKYVKYGDSVLEWKAVRVDKWKNKYHKTYPNFLKLKAEYVYYVCRKEYYERLGKMAERSIKLHPRGNGKIKGKVQQLSGRKGTRRRFRGLMQGEDYPSANA